MTPTVLRSPRHGCFRLRTNHWGSYLAPCDDPDGDNELNETVLRDALAEFAVPETLPRIPADLWQRWVQLAFHFAPKVRAFSLEVGVRILVSSTDPSQYRMLVPRQSVSGGSVHAHDFDDSIDLVSGEKITAYPPDGWIPCGSSHSHGTMGAFFSSVDDGNELGDPGLHITVGSINPTTLTYDLVASITANRVRYKLPWQKFVDPDPVQVSFHPDVLEYVKAEPAKGGKIPSIYDGGTRYPYGYGWGSQRSPSYAGQPTYNWLPKGRQLHDDRAGAPGRGLDRRPWSQLTKAEQDALYAAYNRPAATGSGKGKTAQGRRRRQRPSARSRSSSPIGIYEYSLSDLIDAVADNLGAALAKSDGDCAKELLINLKKVDDLGDLIDEVSDGLIDMAVANGMDPESFDVFFEDPTVSRDAAIEALGQQILTDVIQEDQLLLLPAGIDSDAETDSHDP
jgi:hypothetical protein